MQLKTHGGLFEGIGGFSIGAARTGLTTKWVCEINPYRKQILRQHFQHAEQYRDIRKLTNPTKVDILTGGFPCQNISVAGNGSGIVGPESKLWHEYFRIIYEVQPRYIIIENSVQLRNKGFEYILHDLSKIGYDAQWECLRAIEFGYPHQRERLFIVAYPHKVGRFAESGELQIFKSIAEVFGKTPGQVDLPVPIKRIHPRTNNGHPLSDYGLSCGMDRQAIAAIGDSVLPDIAEYIFRCILLHNKLNVQVSDTTKA